MIRIYADSTNDLGPELIAKYNIRIVPLYVNMGEKTYTDWVNITPDEIYAWSDANKTTPTTAAFSIGDAEEALGVPIYATDCDGESLVRALLEKEKKEPRRLFRPYEPKENEE